MRVALVSNWGRGPCGVSNFGYDFADALRHAGHDVFQATWDDPVFAIAEKVVVNWDSGTLTMDKPLPNGATVLVHHVYRGRPNPGEGRQHLLSPVRGAAFEHPRDGDEPWTYFPYPVSTTRVVAEVVPGTIGVTTIRKEGVDYLTAAAARRGLRVCLPDRWRTTDEEIARLAACEVLAAWYTNSPGRSLALATMLAAERPILLSTGSQMFQYAEGSPDIYWTPYTNQDVEIIAQGFDVVRRDLAAGVARIPRALAEAWSWPVAIQALEALW